MCACVLLVSMHCQSSNHEAYGLHGQDCNDHVVERSLEVSAWKEREKYAHVHTCMHACMCECVHGWRSTHVATWGCMNPRLSCNSEPRSPRFVRRWHSERFADRLEAPEPAPVSLGLRATPTTSCSFPLNSNSWKWLSWWCWHGDDGDDDNDDYILISAVCMSTSLYVFSSASNCYHCFLSYE